MWVVLHERHDDDSVWAGRQLASRGLAPLELVTADELAAARWEHRIGAGPTSSVLELPDGRTIESGRVLGALNRLVAVPPEAVAGAFAADREYALQEFYAFFTSWLAGLPGRMVNRPSPQALAGPWLSPPEWLALAAHAGLEAPAFRRSSRAGAWLGVPEGTPAAVLVVGRRALAPPTAPPEARAGAGRLARLVRTPLLEVRFRVGPNERWTFAGAEARPPLRRYGAIGIGLLATALTGETA
ncbi:MAG TPA: hypothetical protein VG144_01125 [Gaiellaceae bacterium]|nr:hypothetical protein [Gaiellaceae bacterium]